MANYQRYQTLSSAEQYLFSASCPVWVSRYQISWDTQTGARLLQTRMVNLSEKVITAVYLRVRCRDAQDQELTTLHLVPVTGLMVMAGEIFGDDKIVQLWPGRTAFAEIFAERVCFSDGTAWNESEPTDYFAVPAPKQVRPTDAAYPRLALAAREGGVRNDYYYQAALQAWLCTCGVPNPQTTLRCRHCGAERIWLEEHMNAETLLTPKPTPKPEPEPEPEPEPLKPEISAPLEKFDLASYLTNEPMTTPVPPEEEFPAITPRQEEPAAPPAPPEKKSHPGRIIAIVLAVLLFLGIGGWFGYKNFLKPYLSYQEAVAAESEGKFEDAILRYEQLGDYGDSKHRILWCQAQLAAAEFARGNYEEAYEMFRALELSEGYDTLEGFENKAADCLYSKGVTAYNGGDLDAAWECVERLEFEYPAYADTRQLRNCCSYGFGKNALDQAATYADEGNYEAARNSYLEGKQWFASSEGYSNSADMMQYCDYYVADSTARLASQSYDAAAVLEALGQFTALGSYSDSNRRRLDCMYDYVMFTYDADDPNTLGFLTELIDEEYPGAQEFYDELYRMDVSVELLTEPDGNGVREAYPGTASLEDLDRLYISYEITGGAADDSVTIQLVYTLPGTAGGRILLNEGGNRTSVVRLYDLVPVKATKDGEVRLQFYDAETGDELASYTITIPVETETTESPSTGG